MSYRPFIFSSGLPQPTIMVENLDVAKAAILYPFLAKIRS